MLRLRLHACPDSRLAAYVFASPAVHIMRSLCIRNESAGTLRTHRIEDTHEFSVPVVSASTDAMCNAQCGKLSGCTQWTYKN